MAGEVMQVHVDAPGVYEFRQGAASILETPKGLKIEGTIMAPADFFEKRKDSIDAGRSNVTYSLRKRYIRLYVDEHSERGTDIMGRLEFNPDLAAFEINGSKRWTVKELVALARMGRRFFLEPGENKTLIESLSTFTARLEVELKQKDDRKGNTLNSIESKLTAAIPMSFKLSLPIFEGDVPPSTFIVEVVPDVTDSGAGFRLESVEMQEIVEMVREKIIRRQLERFGDAIPIMQIERAG